MVWVLIQTPWAQNWIASQVTRRLSRDLQTEVSIRHVSFSLFNKMHLEGVLISDRQKDTLLYAGDVKVRITDWFFFKKQAELKYIGLEDAVIKFQRSDSVWRQQFIFDYFGNSKTASGKKKKPGIQFDLKKVELKNVSFIQQDAWRGHDMRVHVGVLELDAENINLASTVYDINSLVVSDPVVALRNYQGLKPKSIAAAVSVRQEADSLPEWNKALTVIKIRNLKIENGIFKNDKENGRAPLPGFDGQHIFFSHISGELTETRFDGDSLFSKLKLTATERSGLVLKNLSADMKFTPQAMAFNNLDLRTNQSRIRNFFMMSYDDLDDMDDFIEKVKMTAQFSNAEVGSDDIAFFAPSLKTWKKKIILKGKVRGTLNDLVGNEMMIQAGNSTLLNGDIKLIGLPDIEKTFIDFKANDFRTTYADALAIVPVIKKVTAPDLKKLEWLRFRGNFTGFLRDFVTFGTLETKLGTVKCDLNMKLPRGQSPVYSGNIVTDDFQLGTFFGDSTIGSIAMTGNVQGSGFSEKDLNTLLDGKISYLDYNHYRYHQITAKGKFFKKLFDGIASVDDENIKLSLNGVIDLNGSEPSFDFLADVDRLNLKPLLVTKDSINFRGKLNLDFSGDNIDHFLGTARITKAELIRNGTKLPFDSLTLTSSFADHAKTLSANSNEFSADITGDFTIRDLPNAFQLFLTKYYPSYIKPPKTYPQNETFHFDITTGSVDDYIRMADSSLSGFNYSHLYGDLNLAEHSIDMHALIPQFKYRNYNFDEVQLKAKGSFDSLSLDGEARNIRINDSLSVPYALFNIRARNDSSKVSITAGANQTLDRANLNALVLTYYDGIRIAFDPSTFTINGKTWSIDKSGELEFRTNTPARGQLVLKEGEQKVVFSTHPSSTGNRNDLQVELTKLNIGDLSPYFLPKNRLEGLISGHITVQDPMHNPVIHSDDFQTEFLRVDNDSLGALQAVINYDDNTKELTAKGNTLNQENYIGFDARLFPGSKLRQKDNIIALKPRNFQIKILERFLGSLFSDMRGYITGDVAITGEFDHLSVTGRGRLKDAGLRVNFTQCFYNIRDTIINLTPNEINLDGIVLTDPVTKNPIYVNGSIQHEAFRNMFYDIYIATRKPNTRDEANNRPVQLLNTTLKDNKQFYGSVKGTGSLSLAGSQSDLFMKIDAIASTRDSSNITIPASRTRESGIADFLVERKYGKEMNESTKRINNSNVIYDVDVTANRMVNVRVVLDELTGDEIKGKGSGALNIYSGTNEPLNIRGRFDIEEGRYLFTFQSFFKKPFELRSGSDNYIEWNGDPFGAKIHFDAMYKAERISFYPLAQTLQLNPDILKVRGDVYVIATLTEELFKPKIVFSLDFPPSSPAVTDPGLALVLQQIQKNTNEINKQVTYLIVFNSFAPSTLENENTGTGINFNTISGIFLGVISDQINKILGTLVKNDKYKISVNTSLYNSLIDANNSTGFNLGSNINFSIGRSFFNDRFVITAGGGFDAPLQQSTIQQSIQLLPDVTMEWLINQAGTLRASFFYRENTDYLTTSTTGGPGKERRYGGNLTFRKDFDKIGELLRSKKNKAKKAAQKNNQPVNNEPGQ